jgi:hypothetical protein
MSEKKGSIGKVILIAGAAAVLLLVGIFGWQYLMKPQRSVAAFCKTYQTTALALRSKYDNQVDAAVAEKDDATSLFMGVSSLLEAQGDIAVLFDRLERVAPDDIQSDVAALRDTFQQNAKSTAQNATNPFGLLASGLVSAFQNQGSYKRVDQYIRNHCDLSFMKRHDAERKGENSVTVTEGAAKMDAAVTKFKLGASVGGEGALNYVVFKITNRSNGILGINEEEGKRIFVVEAPGCTVDSGRRDSSSTACVASAPSGFTQEDGSTDGRSIASEQKVAENDTIFYRLYFRTPDAITKSDIKAYVVTKLSSGGYKLTQIGLD